MPKKSKEIIYVIGASLIPVIGCLFFHWTLFNMLFYYWLETSTVLFFALISLFTRTSYEDLFAGSFLGESIIARILAYSVYAFFWLTIHIALSALVGMFIFVLFHPVYPGWYIPNDVLLGTFVNALGFIYTTALFYLVKFIDELVSKKNVSRSEYQRNLYIRAGILIVTILSMGELIHFFHIPVIVGVFIFVILKLIVEIKLVSYTSE